MKEKHRKRILANPHKDKQLIKAEKRRVIGEMKQGKDFDSNAKYLTELERWKH